MPQSRSISRQESEKDIKALKSEISCLQVKLDQLQSQVEDAKADLDSFKFENAVLSSDLQKEWQTNSNLKQQLEEERFFYQKEKEYFCKELADKKFNYNENICYKEIIKNNQSYQKINKKIEQYEAKVVNLKNKVEVLLYELQKNSELSSTLCQKFLRMKQTRDKISSDYQKLQGEYLKVMVQTLNQVDNTRKEVNLLLDKEYQQHHPSSSVTSQVLQQNCHLMHENFELRLEIEKLKYMNGKTVKNEKRRLKPGQQRLTSNVGRHYSASIIENSSRNTEKYSSGEKSKVFKLCEERRRKGYRSENNSIMPLVSNTLKEFYASTTANSEFADSADIWGSNIHPSRTTSAPEIPDLPI